MGIEAIFWVIFVVFVVTMLALDLGVFHRQAHVIHLREALSWCALWVTLAGLFNLGIYLRLGANPALEFLTGYLLEYSLSVDNIFVFLMIFTYFRVPYQHQHKVLFWGILGALLMRALFILTGVTLIQRFHWVIYIMGAFLVLTGIKMALRREEEINPERNPVLRLFRRFMPVTEQYVDGGFFVKQHGRLFATPLLIVVLVVETTDVIFAVDSIPAILAITLDPMIVFTSNVFAILGLRALYFALAGIMRLFHYLPYGLSFILVFVGIKMLLVDLYKIPIGVALATVAAVLVLSVVASILFPPKTAHTPPAADPLDLTPHAEGRDSPSH
jgi:TerC family integral membrane protein